MDIDNTIDYHVLVILNKICTNNFSVYILGAGTALLTCDKGLFKDSYITVTYEDHSKSLRDLCLSLRFSTAGTYNLEQSVECLPEIFAFTQDGQVQIKKRITWSDNMKVMCIGDSCYYDFVHECLVTVRYGINYHNDKIKIYATPPLCTGVSVIAEYFTKDGKKTCQLRYMGVDVCPFHENATASSIHLGFRELKYRIFRDDDLQIKFVLGGAAIRFQDIMGKILAGVIIRL